MIISSLSPLKTKNPLSRVGWLNSKKMDGVYANATLPGLVIKPEPADKRAGEAKQHRKDSVHPDDA
jgi:hypothetical protein